MKTPTYTLSGDDLNWAVLQCECMRLYGSECGLLTQKVMCGAQVPDYLGDVRLAQKIIDREGIKLVRGNPLHFPSGNEFGELQEPLWIAVLDGGLAGARPIRMHGRTTAIAAMRCYVTSKFGDEFYVLPQLWRIRYEN